MLTLKPCSDDILDLSGDLNDEVNAYKGGLAITLSNGNSAKLEWNQNGFTWINPTGDFNLIEPATDDDWPALHTDSNIEWVKVEDKDGIKVILSKSSEAKLKPLIDESAGLACESDDIEDILEMGIKWLYIRGKLNL